MSAFFKTLYRGWCRFGHALGVINTTIVLTIVYWLVLPLFALSRFSDPLAIRRSRGKNSSYWSPSATPKSSLEDLYRMF